MVYAQVNSQPTTLFLKAFSLICIESSYAHGDNKSARQTFGALNCSQEGPISAWRQTPGTLPPWGTVRLIDYHSECLPNLSANS